MYKFLVVVEKAGDNYSAYAPNLPGCIATGKSKEKVEENMIEAMEFHIQGLLEDGLSIPKQEAYASVFAIPEHG
jgi:predicted RNase H-like HicB family nuclease